MSIPHKADEQILQATAPHKRLRALDSLRGLAASVVVCTHCYWMIPKMLRDAHPDANFAMLSVAVGGRFSVMLFFVLSGFVLSLPYSNGRNQSYSAFIVRRLFRLYPPCAFAVLVGAGFCYFLTDSATRIGWQHPATLHEIAAALLMTGVKDYSTDLDGPLWSLIIEIRISMLFPILFMLTKRFGWSFFIFGLIVSIACCEVNIARGATHEETTHFGNDAIGALLLTGRYMGLFLFGIIAAVRFDEIKRRLLALSKDAHLACCVAAIGIHVSFVKMILWDHGYADVLYGLIAAYFIVCAASFTPLARRLCGPVFLWLGDISFSLYLIHVPVLYGVINALQPYMPRIPSIILAVPAVFLVAHVMHQLVERPSMRLGRKLSDRVDSRRKRAAAVH